MLDGPLPSAPLPYAPLPRLMTDEDGLTFEYLDADETEFLYEEIFVRRSYLQHGVCVPRRGSPIVVDAGANVGLFSLHVLRENARARVLALEPSPACFAALERNLSASTEARCLQLLVGDRPGTRCLHCYDDAPGESTCHPAERRRQRARLRAAASSSGNNDDHDDEPAASLSDGERDEAVAAAGEALASAESAASSVVRVRAVTLSALLSAWRLPRVDLLKIDVEGDELSALRGLRATHWRLVRQCVVEVHDVHGRLARVLALLRRHGFSARAERQASSAAGGYVMLVPRSLELHLVYATRKPRCSRRRAAATGRKMR